MARTNDDGGANGLQLPGTGGDFIDGSDVEGHRRLKSEDEIAKREGETGMAPRKVADDELDVEGHRRLKSEDEIAKREGETGMAPRKVADDELDVEGHRKQ